MNGTEIISYLTTNAPTLLTGVGPIVGSLITVLFLRKNTSTAEFEKIKAGKFDEVLEDLLAMGKITYTELYKANNFLKIAKKADKYFSQKTNTKISSCFEFDWLIRYYEAVGNISNESMQDLWAKILAGEINAPSSYSLKTIDILRNMRKSDVELFVNICKHSFGCNDGELFLPNYNGFLDTVGVTYSDVMKLSEMGLIFSDGMIALNITLPCEPTILLINRELVLTMSARDVKNQECSIAQFPFTQVGIELATLVEDMPTDEEFILFGKEIAKDKKYNVGVHRITIWKEDALEYEKMNLLT